MANIAYYREVLIQVELTARRKLFNPAYRYGLKEFFVKRTPLLRKTLHNFRGATTPEIGSSPRIPSDCSHYSVVLIDLLNQLSKSHRRTCSSSLSRRCLVIVTTGKRNF